MATKYLSADASLSAAVWWTTSGGSTTTSAPTTGDDANLNGHTLTVDQTLACDNVVGAGTLAVSGSRTINATLGSSADTWGCTLNGSQTVTINGNVNGYSSSFGKIQISGASTVVNINGTLTAGSTTHEAIGVYITAGSLTVSGPVFGSTSNGSCYGIYCPSGGTITLTATSFGQSSGAIPVNLGGGVLTVNGDINNRFLTQSGGTSTITGNITDLNGNGCVSIGAGTSTINGNVTGSSTDNPQGFSVSFTGGTLNINGTVTGGSGHAGGALSNACYAVGQRGGTLNLTGSMVEGSRASPICHGDGTFNFTPGSSDTITIGSQVMVKSGGGGSSSVIIIEDD